MTEPTTHQTSLTAIAAGTDLNQTYRIDSLIGVGGMGEVFKGHNIHTGEAVAIKIVLPEFAQDEFIIELFRKEARILHHLNHDAIVRYYGFSLDAATGRHYLAMEFIDGFSLAEQVKQQPLSVEECNLLRYRLADGLQKAHEAGIIHRDISPENIILPGGRVERAKIIDFGIAKSNEVGGKTLLRGKFAGKYNFVSPEQLGLFGANVAAASDVFSLGLTLAAALMGRAFNMNGSPAELLEKRQSVPQLDAIPQEVRSLLRLMLEPDPAKRMPSMSVVRDWIGAVPNAYDRDDATVVVSSALARFEPPPATSLRTETSKPQLGEPREQVREDSAPSGAARPIRSIMAACGLVAAVAIGSAAGWYYFKSDGNGVNSNPVVDADKFLTPEEFVTGFNGGACFLAIPARTSSAGQFVLAYGNSVQVAQQFSSSYKARFKGAADVRFNLLTDGQCPYVPLLRGVNLANAKRPWLKLLSIRL